MYERFGITRHRVEKLLNWYITDRAHAVRFFFVEELAPEYTGRRGPWFLVPEGTQSGFGWHGHMSQWEKYLSGEEVEVEVVSSAREVYDVTPWYSRRDIVGLRLDDHTNLLKR